MSGEQAGESDYMPAVVVDAIEALAVEAESWPDDEADSGGAVADWLRSRIPQNPSPAGYPAPTMDPSERANGGSAVASRTGTGPAGEAQHYPSLTVTSGTIGCDCGWEVERTRLDQAIDDYARHVADLVTRPGQDH